MFKKDRGSKGRHNGGEEFGDNAYQEFEPQRESDTFFDDTPAYDGASAYDDAPAYDDASAYDDAPAYDGADQGDFEYATTTPATVNSAFSPADTGSFAGKPGSRKRKKEMAAADKNAVTTYDRANGTYNKKDRKKGGTATKVILVILIILFLGVIGIGAALFWYVGTLEEAIHGEDAKEEAAIQDSLAPTMSDEPFYIVLLGNDARNGSKGGRSDTCILTRVDPKNAVVSMISIPRDTAIRYKGSTVKFNAAYSFDGAAGSIKAASELCGVDISHYAQVNFKGLADVVDAIGGVDVDVPVAIRDSHAGYVNVDAGKQHLNGRQALVFARSRAYATGDFQRSTNQRLLCEAVIKRVLNDVPASNLPTVITRAAKSISTDLTLIDIIGLATKFQDADKVTFYSALVPSSTAMVDGVSYVVCDTASLSEMMKLMNEGKDPSKAATDGTVKSSKAAKKKGMTTVVK